MLKHILIIGGSSGLGLELAERYVALGHTVAVTGRKDPVKPQIKFINFSIDSNGSDLPKKIDSVVSQFPEVNTLVYAAGYYQEGHLDKITDEPNL